jgi:hypothetical protein
VILVLDYDKNNIGTSRGISFSSFIFSNNHNATLGSGQLAWLEDLLARERKNNRFCVVFSHVNFFREHHTFSANPPVQELHTLIDLFYKYSVNLVIMGHDHLRAEEFFGGTRYITLDAIEDGLEQASYLKLEIKNGELSWIFEKP